MKKLGKVLKTAKAGNIDKNKHLQEFLRRYRETPHSTTKVPPALLLMGFSRHSGLPQIEAPWSSRALDKWHKLAQENDRIAKERMKQEYDHRMRVKECGIEVGCKVLLKLKPHRKSTSKWGKDPYVVKEVNGSMVTAARQNHLVTRNSSFFKRFRYDLEEDIVATDPVEMVTEASANESQPTLAVARKNNTGREGEGVETNEIVSTETNPGSEAPNKVGRPTTEQSRANAANRAHTEAEKRLANPPTRASERVAKQASKSGGKM
jgi:hypothetical protein